MTTFGYFEMTAKDPPPRCDEGAEVVDEEKFFAERLKMEVRHQRGSSIVGRRSCAIR